MNGSEQNDRNRRMRPEKILEMFLEVLQQHASKSYDFPISDLLDQYMHGRLVPNFPEAAMVINSAGQVFSRKVDYLEALLMAMHDKQNAPERNERPDNPDATEKATTEKKRPGRRLKNIDHSSTTIQLAAPKIIKKSASTVEKINLNSSDTSDTDKFKHYCQAVKSKVPVFYERVNLLISDKTDSYFDGSRAISRDDPDCQKNYNVFVGCISFKEKQMMSQRDFLNRIQFDNLDGGFDQTNVNALAAPDFDGHTPDTNSNEPTEQPPNVAGDATSNNETDLLESLRETSLLMDRAAAGGIDDGDSAIVDDDMSQLNSTVDESTLNAPLNSTEQSDVLESSVALDSTINESQVINSTVNNSESTCMLSQSDVSTVAETTVNSTMNATEALDSTQEASNVDETNLTNATSNDETGNGNLTSSIVDETNLTNGTSNDETGMNLTSSIVDETNLTNGTSNDETLKDSTCVDEKSTLDSQLDANVTIIDTNNETLETMQNDSTGNNSDGLDDNGNIFHIKDEYLKLNEIFRLPLSVLQHEVNIKLNIFGIPFGRLRRQVKFALPKDFDSLRTGIKRTRDIDECSTTTTRKFVKLNDGTATPSIEASSTMPPPTSDCDQLPDSSIVPAPDTNTAENPSEATSQPIDGSSLENGISAECSAGDNAPKGDEQSTTQTTLENPSQLVDDVSQSQNDATEDFGASDSLTNDDGPSLAKIPRIDSKCDASSIFDSGIGTEGSQCGTEGTITSRRDTLDLTPPSEEIENELSAEADEQSANRIQEMTNLSEKVHSWHQRLKPILLHSERRNDFDVKETSRNIVASFSDGDSSLETKTQDNRLVSFESIMERRDKADTARYFFSMLQMANNRNIQLIVNHNDSTKLCPQNKIMLKLLNPNIREIDPNIEKN